MSCPFCDYAGPSQVLASFSGSYGGAFAIEPLNPVTPGHTLMIPRRHVAHALVHPEITALTFQCAARYAQDLGWGDCNIITSCGPAATQTVKHLHVHLVPRRPDDGLLLPWSMQSENP